MTSQPARILIVDDHPMVREGLALRIDREPDLNACCAADDVTSAIAACNKHLPDLALIDLNLGDSSGLVLIKQLRELFPEMKILVISMHDENIYAERTLRMGAHGYVMKQEAMENVVLAIRQVLQGLLYVSDAFRTRLLRQLIREPEHHSPHAGLTDIEFNILNLLGMGMTIRDIGRELNRSAKTIESHCARIKKKLNLASGKELQDYAADWVRASYRQ